MPSRRSGRHEKAGAGTEIRFRKPEPPDGPAITALIADSPPLDTNSAYCNLLQCAHFSETCIVAERQGRIIGWISGYRPPAMPGYFFIWQVAVAPDARGEGLGRQMILGLLGRHSADDVTHLITTVTPDNHASWALFTGFARHVGADFTKAPLFDRETHFAGAHETEWQATIGPFPRPISHISPPETDRP